MSTPREVLEGNISKFVEDFFDGGIEEVVVDEHTLESMLRDFGEKLAHDLEIDVSEFPVDRGW